MEYEDREEDDKVCLGEGFVDIDISKSTIRCFVDWVLPQ